jgi:3-oxoacyl-[acyl-carrier protein] reductase
MEKIKVAIVTGGSGGIGRAIVKKLLSNDYNVINVFKSNITAAEKLKTLVESEKDQKGLFINLQHDVSNYDESKKMVEDVLKKFDSIDLLVNNAGVSEGGLLMLRNMEKWWHVVETNLGTTVNCTKAVTQQMIKQKYGKIINMSSVSGIRGTVGNTDYSASKAAIIGFTKAIAKELARFGIIINCIAPGFIDTEMLSNLSEDQKNRIEQSIKSIPSQRIGKSEEIAELVSFLASGKVDYLLGQTIVIDGGHSI